MTQIPPKKSDFHILALSGGGYKGLFTAEVINLIEQKTCTNFGTHFDLICGTSVGGILALALATREIAAQKIVDILTDAGPRIFPQYRPKVWDFLSWASYHLTGFRPYRGLYAAKHNNKELKEALEGIFKDLRLSDLKTRVLIPTANWSKGGPQFFKTPHNLNFHSDPKRKLVDVAMATSAAPVYLPNYMFEHQVYADGGLVGNAPGLFGLHEAEFAIEEAKEATHYLLSIGTLSSKTTADQRKSLDKGVLSWRGELFDFMMACQEQVSGYMLRQKLDKRYFMIDREATKEEANVISLDNADPAATKTLRGLAHMKVQEEFSNDYLQRHLLHCAPDLDYHKTESRNP